MTEAGAEKYKPIFAKKNITFKQLSFADDKALKQVKIFIGIKLFCIIYIKGGPKQNFYKLYEQDIF